MSLRELKIDTIAKIMHISYENAEARVEELESHGVPLEETYSSITRKERKESNPLARWM